MFCIWEVICILEKMFSQRTRMIADTEKPVCDYCNKKNKERKKEAVQEQFNQLEIKFL